MIRRFGRLGFAAALAFAALAAVAIPVNAGDDLYLFTSNYPPNVLLIQDNSYSMYQIEWHPEFDPTATSPCQYFDDDELYLQVVTSGTFDSDTIRAGSQTLNSSKTSDSDCWNTRTIYNPDSTTLYSGKFLNWLFSDAADPYVSEIASATHALPTCSSAACTNCTAKYRRTRNQMAKQVLVDFLCYAVPTGVRIGHSHFRDGSDPNGGYVVIPVNSPSTTQTTNLNNSVKNIPLYTYTPLGETLYSLYSYFMSRTTADLPVGADGTTKFSKYSYRTTGSYSTTSIPASPVESPCQKNFVILVTDGAPTKDDFDNTSSTTAQGFANFDEVIGDYNPDGEDEVPGDSVDSAWYLDDIAKYMHERDFRPDMAGDQTVEVYTVAMNVDPNAADFLERTATLGGGQGFYAEDGDQLGQALLEALNQILATAQSFTAATVPSSRTADGGHFFTTYFLPSGTRAFWEGSLRAWHITASGDIVDANDDCALVDPTAGECNSGPFDPFAVSYWEAADEVPLPPDRTLYVSKLVSGAPTMLDFDVSLGAADLGLLPFTLPGIPAPNPVQYLNSSSISTGSLALNADGLADEVIQFARGCMFGTGVETADIALLGLPCEVRDWRLGDIFHSNPILVGAPRTLVGDASFLDFRATFATRKRVLYAGANDGFLHGFDAGDWDASATPPGYDVTAGGAELFGFMPWMPRKSIKNQVIDAPSNRSYFVDGSPQVADAWLYPTAATLTKDEDDWRTVLVGGLRQGGRHYYALDVTDPSGATYTYPDYMWEFPREDDPNDSTDADSFLPWMGQTWAQPVITRVRVDYNGDTVERWVAIVTGGYSEKGDPNNSLYAAANLEGRSILMLDLKTGEVLAEHKYNHTGKCPSVAYDATIPDQFMCFAIASTPAVFDVDFDGYADVIYVGDVGGNIWKWAIRDVGQDRVNDGSGLRTQPAWEFGRFFRAPSATISSVVYYKSFFTAPAGALEGGKLYVTLGTGQRADLGYAGSSSTTAENNRYYVLIDADPYESVAGIPKQEETDTDGAGPLVALTDLTSSTACTTINAPGYFFRIADGEKFVTRSDIFASHVIAATFTPVATPSDCNAKGTSAIYAFRLGCGQGYFTDGAGNPDRDLGIGAGFPTDPQVSMGAGGSENRVFIQKSGSDLQSIDTDDVDGGGRLLYWREAP